MRITHILLASALTALELPAQRVVAPADPRTPTLTPAATGAPPVAFAVSGTPSTATLNWQWPAGATGFEVYRALAPSGNWAKLSTAPISVTNFADVSGFSFGQTYVYRVVSLYANGSYGNADLQFQPPAPQNPAWVKASQQGASVTLTWAAVPGAARYMVIGATAAEGREVVAPTTSVTYANVAPGTYKWNVGARFDPGAMETPATQWPNASLGVVAASARYRVIITGLSVLRKTVDDPLHYDGRDDEVFVAAQAIIIDRKTGAVVGKQVSQSISYGDVNNPPRIQAGTSSARGGLISGDRVPTGDPTQPAGPVTTSMIPLLAFDGTLTDGKDDVLIFPSVWEVDHGNGAVYSDWLTKVPQMRPSLDAAPDPVPGSALPVYLATGGVVFSAQLGWNWQEDIRLDRPIGSLVVKADSSSTVNVNTYQFRPRVFVLQREELERRLATPFVANNGAKGLSLSIELKEEATRYLMGDYVLHLWIERLP